MTLAEPRTERSGGSGSGAPLTPLRSVRGAARPVRGSDDHQPLHRIVSACIAVAAVARRRRPSRITSRVPRSWKTVYSGDREGYETHEAPYEQPAPGNV